MNNLLPVGSSACERNLATVCTTATPVPLRDLWSPDACSGELLPYLAWAFSVDRWDAAWAESAKRDAVKAAHHIHQHKGTISAIRRVVEPLGYLVKVVEWWQESPSGEPGTFSLEMQVSEAGISDELFQELERLIDDARPVSRHLKKLDISMSVDVPCCSYVSMLLGDVLTIGPYIDPSPIQTSCIAHQVGFPHVIDTMSIYP